MFVLWSSRRSLSKVRTGWILTTLGLFLALSGCGGPRRMEAGGSRPLPPTPELERAADESSDPLTKPLRRRPEPRIRVLLAESGARVEIENSRRAPRILCDFGEEGVRLQDGDGRLLDVGSGFRLEAREGKLLRLGGAVYRGVLDVFINPLGVAVVVNEVPLESYLQSVVPRELGPEAYPDLEALKAQSVAARTFAVAALGNYAHEGYDLFADTRSQVYAGVGTEHPLSNRAVGETEGEIATYAHEPIVALYSSTCGGRTEAFSQIFRGGPIPYLKGGAECRDSISRYHRWEQRVDLSEAASRIERYAPVGPLKNLEVEEKSETGRTVAMRFVGEKDEIVLRGNDVRFALGARSNWIDSMSLRKNEEGFIRQILLRGRGWGHGVGLCQIGAVQRSRDGDSYRSILAHYYDGIRVEKWYDRPAT